MNRHLCLYRGLLLVTLLLVGGLRADIVIMKSGDRKIGKIIAEDDVSVTLQYTIHVDLRDRIKIPKIDTKEIIRQTPAQVEYEAKGLDGLLPSANLLSASDYETIIQDDLRTFIAKYPGTPEAEKVKGMIDTLNEEKSKVLGRQVKMECIWLDEATAKREKYNIEAYRLRLRMKKAMEDLSHEQVMPKEIKALRAFDELRTHFPASPQYVQAIPEALDILDKYEKRLSAMALNQPIIKAERDRARAASDRAREAIEQEERIFKTTLDSQKKGKLKWRDVSEFDLKSIMDAQAAVAKEKLELKSMNLAVLQNEVENFNAVIRCIAGGDLAEAAAIMSRLRPNKTSLINESVFDDLDQQLKKLRGP